METNLTKAEKIQIIENEIKSYRVSEEQAALRGRVAVKMDNKEQVKNCEKAMLEISKVLALLNEELEKMKAEPEK